MRDFSDALELTRKRIADAAAYLKIDELRARRPLLETEASRPDLWDDPDAAKRVTGELSAVVDDLERYERLVRELEDAETLHELAREEDDESARRPRSTPRSQSLDAELRGLELRSLFSGEHDERDALCTIQAGRGRRRRPGLGRDALPHVPALGRAPRLRGRGGGVHAGLRGRASRRSSSS